MIYSRLKKRNEVIKKNSYRGKEREGEAMYEGFKENDYIKPRYSKSQKLRFYFIFLTTKRKEKWIRLV